MAMLARAKPIRAILDCMLRTVSGGEPQKGSSK
jgi:hypothetical protein